MDATPTAPVAPDTALTPVQAAEQALERAEQALEQAEASAAQAAFPPTAPVAPIPPVPLAPVSEASSLTVTPEQLQEMIRQAASQMLAQAPIAPDGGVQDPPKPPIISRLKELESELAGSTFAQRVEHLAHDGYQTVINMEQERPALRTLITIVGEIVSAMGVAA